MAWLLVLSLALAQAVPGSEPTPDLPPPPVAAAASPPVALVPPGSSGPGDVVLWVRRDGNWFVDDKLVMDSELPRVLSALLVADPGARLVVSPHEEAPYGRVNEAARAGVLAGFQVVAVEISGIEPPADEGPGIQGEVVDLTGEQGVISDKELKDLKPKRHLLPQNPYAHTDFTAYTLERGETRIGLATITYGLTPRVQLATAPIPDAVGVWNLIGKANVIRQGRMDYAITGNVYYAPIADILNRLGAGSYVSPTGRKKNEPSFTASLTWAEVGGRASLRITEPWSAHLGLGFARINAKGELPLGQIPKVDIPQVGEIGGQKLRVAPQLIGDLMQLRFASDYRFNRRDTLVLQFSAPTYFAVRGIFHPPKQGIPKELRNLYLAVGYDDWIKLGSFYTASIAWQFSWNKVDLRLGIPVGRSPLGYFQALDLSYRFGGQTRRGERDLRRDYRANKKALGEGGDAG